MRSALLVGSLLTFLVSSVTPTRCQVIKDWVNLSDGPIFVLRGCHSLGTLSQEVPPEGPGDLTVETCISSCNSHNYNQGGVGNHKCLCDNDAVLTDDVVVTQCQDLYCPGNVREACGSSTHLLLYEK